MRGLILGKSPQNEHIRAFFEQQGFAMHTETDPFSLRRLTGQVGQFRATFAHHCATFGFLVVTQPAHAPAPVLDEGQAHCLRSLEKEALCGAAPLPGPVCFLLDHLQASALDATVRALRDARQLAAQHHQVVCFYRHADMEGPGVAALYREAQNAGVAFVPYGSLSVSYDKAQAAFLLKTGDNAPEICTSLLFADGGEEMHEGFRHCLSVLRLWPDSEGRLPKDKYFLVPVRSSRRGVFLIGQSLAGQRLDEGLRYIASTVRTHEHPADKSENIAHIDGDKCALCYTCYRACPHAATQQKEKARQMDCLPLACEGCGNCVSLCPADAIRLENAAVPAAGGKHILALCCQNSAALALPKALRMLESHPESGQVEMQTVPCGGSIGLEDITGALLRHDKVLVATCMEGACRHFEGSHRAKLQCGRLKTLLQDASLPQNRVRYIQTSHAMPGVLKDHLLDFLEE